MTAEHDRLTQAPGPDDPWRAWGPYLSGRQWGTVREDYSADGDAWNAFPFDHAHQRTYRWGEDGIAGVCDRFGFLNLAVAMWNGNDDRLKERWFGLTNPEGNHGEDVKEYWWPLDATPTHSYAQLLYRYPQQAFPYQQLREENARRGLDQPEYELTDTGILDDGRWFDVVVTHAKASPTQLLVQIEATNHGPDTAALHLIPQLWFRNTWAWGSDDRMPALRLDGSRLVATHGMLGECTLQWDGAPQVLMCDNETNAVALFGAAQNRTRYPKDGINQAVVHGDSALLNPVGTGTRAGLHHHFEAVAPGETVRIRLVLSQSGPADLTTGFDKTLQQRHQEADEFYAAVIPEVTSDVDRDVARMAFAGLLWGKQLYRYGVREWLAGDPAGPVPPVSRLAREPFGRNTSWKHVRLADVISMPDEWEYPWFAAWDLAFHAVTLAHIDPAFAKQQLMLLCRAWAMHPDGQLPAYEWSFSDVNPPVHAWAAWQVFQIDGGTDLEFLTHLTSKLLLNYGWWVNRKDPDGSDLFEGGFLGMDNISVFDRSKSVPAGWRLEQSDATSWMAFFCLSMVRITLELSRHEPAWQGVAGTFLERFLAISEAVEQFGAGKVSLWDDADGFFYDALVNDDGDSAPVRVRSFVGLVPLLAVATIPADADLLTDFNIAREWLQRRRPELFDGAATPITSGPQAGGRTLCLVHPERYPRLLARLCDEAEFLGAHGVRSLSAAYRDGDTVQVLGEQLPIRYVPGVSDSGMFGGNSNWRGPIWMPVNVLLMDALRGYGEGAGADLGLDGVADDLHDRILNLFRPGPDGRRPSDPRDVPGGPDWSHPTFSEYFDGDTGAGLGASHQTGWTALVAHLICRGR